MPWKIFPGAIKQQNARGARKYQGTDSLDRGVIQSKPETGRRGGTAFCSMESRLLVSLNPHKVMIAPWFSDHCWVGFVTKYEQARAGDKSGSANLGWHVAVHLLRFLHLLRGVTLRGWVFVFLLQSCGGPALGRARVHGREVPRRAGAAGSIIQISFKVNAHSWGGHVAFNNIPLVLWSATRNKV